MSRTKTLHTIPQVCQVVNHFPNKGCHCYIRFRQHAERDESKAKVKERAKNETKANELKFGAPSPTRNPDGGQDAIKIAMGRSKKPGA